MSRSKKELTEEPPLKLTLDIFKLIQPDLLSVAELRDVLSERGVLPGLLSQGKDKLVSLFKKVAYPLPQRELKNNYRGSILMKQRKKGARIKFDDTADKSSFTIGVMGSPTISRSTAEKQCAERLKPPPDLINFEKRKIKINSSTSSTVSFKHTTTSSPNLDKIVIKKRKTSESSECTTDKKVTLEINKISLSEQTDKKKLQELDNGLGKSNEECNGTSNPVPKKVSLKRNHLFSKAPSLSPEDSNKKLSSEPDKKRKPITWP